MTDLLKVDILACFPINHRLMDGPEWWLGKMGDVEAAGKLVEQAWAARQSSLLKEKLSGKSPLLLTVPGTSGQNMVTLALADLIQKDLGGTVIVGDDLFRHVEMRQIKYVAKKDRIFLARRFEARADVSFLREQPLVLVEDVISSGITVFSFAKMLQRQGIQPLAIVTFMGKDKLIPEPQLVSKLQAALKRGNSGIRAKDFAELLTRVEAQEIIDMANEASKDGNNGIAGTIQRIFDIKTSVFVEGSTQ